MTTDRLIELGFEQQADTLRAPVGARVSLTALDRQCWRIAITFPSGNALTCVVSGWALKLEAPPPDPPPIETDTS